MLVCVCVAFNSGVFFYNGVSPHTFSWGPTGQRARAFLHLSSAVATTATATYTYTASSIGFPLPPPFERYSVCRSRSPHESCYKPYVRPQTPKTATRWTAKCLRTRLPVRELSVCWRKYRFQSFWNFE